MHVESKILPEDLQSIITFKEEEKNKDEGLNVDESTDVFNLMKKRKRSSSTDCIKEKKRKKETLKISPIVVKSNKKKKKDKYKKNDSDSDQKNSSYEKSDNENNQKALFSENLDCNTMKSEKAVSINDIKVETNLESSKAVFSSQDLNSSNKLNCSENNQNILTVDHLDSSIGKSETILSSNNKIQEKVKPNNSVIDSDYLNSSCEPNITENKQKTFLNKQFDYADVKAEEIISNEIIQKESNMDYNDDSAVKKKRKRNKGKKIKSDATLSTSELRIMSK